MRRQPKLFSRIISLLQHPQEIFSGRIQRREAKPPAWIEFTQTYQQGFRIADFDCDVYELYIGENTPPDFDAPPAVISSSFPFGHPIAPPPMGTKTVYAVVRKRNDYGLLSFNVWASVFVIDSAGNEVLGLVSSPSSITIYDAQTEYIRVMARYITDEKNPADTWEVYIKVGSDPIPGVDSPVYTASMSFPMPDFLLNCTLGSYTPGDIIHVIVTALRSADNARGNATVIQHTLAIPPELESGQVFGGYTLEYK